MNDEAVKTLTGSKDSAALKRAAVQLAQSPAADDLEALGKFLMAPDFLNRLDSAEDYQGTYAGLRLARVTQTLADNRLPAADKLLIKLTNSATFNQDVLRMQLLVRALAAIKVSPLEAITYWDNASQPGSPIGYDVVQALIANQSPPAMALLERKFANPQETTLAKTQWLRRLILPQRNDEPLLGVLERLLNAGQPFNAQLETVEALFDYKPKEWYRGCEAPEPPLRVLAPTASKEILKRIGQRALTQMKLPAELEVKVKAAMKEIGGEAETKAK